MILIGSHLGHPRLSPVADPTLKNTPKPFLVTNVPSPRNAKCRASPPMVKDPMVTSAPTETNATNSSSAPAPVSSLKPTDFIVTKDPNFNTRVSTSNMNVSTRPSEKVSSRRMASSFCVPSKLRSSAVCRSVIVADMGRPGKNLAPPEAT